MKTARKYESVAKLVIDPEPGMCRELDCGNYSVVFGHFVDKVIQGLDGPMRIIGRTRICPKTHYPGHETKCRPSAVNKLSLGCSSLDPMCERPLVPPFSHKMTVTSTFQGLAKPGVQIPERSIQYLVEKLGAVLQTPLAECLPQKLWPMGSYSALMGCKPSSSSEVIHTAIGIRTGTRGLSR